MYKHIHLSILRISKKNIRLQNIGTNIILRLKI